MPSSFATVASYSYRILWQTQFSKVQFAVFKIVLFPAGSGDSSSRMDQLRRLFPNGRPWDFLHWNFYRVHLSYFILTIIVSSVIVYGSGVNGNSDDAEAQFRLRYIDALFLCASAMTNTGLNTVNLGSITAFQQSVLAILLLLGNIVTVSMATVWIRRHFFRRYSNKFVQHSQAGRQLVENIDRESAQPSKVLGHVRSGSGNGSIRRRSARSEQGPVDLFKTETRINHLEIGHGGFPYPWDTRVFRSLSSRLGFSKQQVSQGHHHQYLTFKPSLDSKVAAIRRETISTDRCLRAVFTPWMRENLKN